MHKKPKSLHLKVGSSMVLTMLAGLAFAAPDKGLHFTHHDWEIACDNTRTCRVAGYHGEDGDDDGADGESLPVSVLLTRRAGAGEPVKAELQIGNPDQDEAGEELIKLAMSINGQPAGPVMVRQSIQALSAAQTASLIAVLGKKSKIEWSDGKRVWRLSGKGAAAVLLKMDEFQGRLGTPGALIRKGTRDERGVLPPLPAPVIQAAAVPRKDDVQLSKAALKALQASLKSSMKECSDPVAGQPEEEVTVRRLSGTKLLASMTCWTGAYNQGSAYWVVNARAPFAPQWITNDASTYSEGVLGASHKGRGAGDCWASEEWTWDGKRFVHSSKGTMGQCKSVAAGGAWSLPVLVTTVRRAPASLR